MKLRASKWVDTLPNPPYTEIAIGKGGYSVTFRIVCQGDGMPLRVVENTLNIVRQSPYGNQMSIRKICGYTKDGTTIVILGLQVVV